MVGFRSQHTKIILIHSCHIVNVIITENVFIDTMTYFTTTCQHCCIFCFFCKCHIVQIFAMFDNMNKYLPSRHLFLCHHSSPVLNIALSSLAIQNLRTRIEKDAYLFFFESKDRYPAGKMTLKIRCFNVRYHVVAMSETSWI